MKHFTVKGMSCAACSFRIEKVVSRVDGVSRCNVSLLTNSMTVEGTASDKAIIDAVKKAGYSAELSESVKKAPKGHTVYDDDALAIENIKHRLVLSIIFLLILMYFSMGHMVWNWPLPDFLVNDHLAQALLQFILTLIIIVINRQFFISGAKSIVRLSPNMDSLVALGAGASFLYSTWQMIRIALTPGSGEMPDLYFESAAMILTLITVGKLLEAKAKGKTTSAIQQLICLQPQSATIIKDGNELTIPVEQLQKGDIFIVKPGESIPVDGIIIDGNTAVDESALTGESVPADKGPGASISAATINQTGFIKCRATAVGEDTSLSKIITLISDTAASKAPIAKVADRVSGIFVPVVIGIAILTTAIWLLVGQGFGLALQRGISVLVISCPCALGLATPVAIMAGSGLGARNGILFKTAASLEITGKVDIVALDKTGTITEGNPQVTDIIPEKGIPASRLWNTACSLEGKSEHPLAKAICQKGAQLGYIPGEIAEFTAIPGKGVQGILDGEYVYGGNLDFLQQQNTAFSSQICEKALQLAREGKTPIFFGCNGMALGVLAVADIIKKDSRQAIEQLKDMGKQVVMITGDNSNTAQNIGSQAGVNRIISQVLPGEKEAAIRSLQNSGKVAMVGDGINDAPALVRADIGIAIGAGTDIAIDAADIVLMNSSLLDVAAAIRLSKATLRNIHQNLFWAFFYNTLGIPLAAGAFIPLLSWELNPMFAAAAMSLSSFCVVTNSLRINMVKIYRDKNSNEKKGRINTMERTFKIEGMMCAHCESHVKKSLESLPQVDEAVVSYKSGTATVKLNNEIDDSAIKKAIEDEGYTFIG